MSKTAFFIIDYSITGGVERVNANLCRLFMANGIETGFIISLRSANDTPDIKYPPHLKTIVLFPDGKEKNIADKLQFVIKEHAITTLIFQGDNMTITLAVQEAAKRAKCRAILHYHGSPYGYLKKYIYTRDILQKPVNAFKLAWSHIVYPFKKMKLKKVIMQSADGFVCVSEGVRSELFDLFSFSMDTISRIISIPNPLTFDISEPAFYRKETKVVYVSRLHRKHKNSMMALLAWKLIHKKYPAWKLYVIGDGALKKSMEAYCRKHDLSNVIFTGMINNVQDYLQNSSISILTSDCEGLGMGLLESASYKNALLVTRADGGITDIVEEAVTGYLVPRNDIACFAEKLSLLMSNEDLRNKMGDNAYRKLARFDDNIILARWKQLLAEEN